MNNPLPPLGQIGPSTYNWGGSVRFGGRTGGPRTSNEQPQPFDPRSVNLNSPSVKNALYALQNRPESYLLGGGKSRTGAPMLSPEDLSTFMNYGRQLNQSLGSPLDFGKLFGDNETYSFGTELY